MKRRDQWSALFWLAFAGLVAWASWQMGIGTLQVPGPGLLPGLAAVFVGVLALLLLIAGTVQKEAGAKAGDLWAGRNWRPVALVAGALTVYSLVLTRLGFLVATFGLLFLLFSVLGRSRLWLRAAAALATTLAAYLVFARWLDVPLPRGLLGL